MELWEAIVLGIIQGLTEFLPVSSSGHLVLGQYFFGIREPQLFFNIMLHVGTLGAIIAVFWRDIWDILTSLFGFEPKPRNDPSYTITKKYGRKFALLIIIGSIPTGIMAFILKKFIEDLFANPLFASCMLLITGGILWLSGRIRIYNTIKGHLNFVNALIIGTAQGIAILPGISRSGATISTAIVRGIQQNEAARYSLLLSVPAILGALLLDLKDTSGIDLPMSVIIAGTIAAFLVGYLAIRFLLRVLKSGNFSKFAYYCWAAGIISILAYVILSVRTTTSGL